jgi:hypothetical protein
MTELSTTRRPATPITFSSGSTTAMGSSMAPILQVHEGCSALSSRSRRNSSICSSVTQSAPGCISRPRNGAKAGCWKISRVRRTQARISVQSSGWLM